MAENGEFQNIYLARDREWPGPPGGLGYRFLVSSRKKCGVSLRNSTSLRPAEVFLWKYTSCCHKPVFQTFPKPLHLVWLVMSGAQDPWMRVNSLTEIQGPIRQWSFSIKVVNLNILTKLSINHCKDVFKHSLCYRCGGLEQELHNYVTCDNRNT